MLIERVSKLSRTALSKADFSVLVDEEAKGPFDGPKLVIFVTVRRYQKQYSFSSTLFRERSSDRRLIAVARVNNAIAGFIAASTAWNNCAQIDDLAVARDHRRAGIGRLLMDEAGRWAKQRGLFTLRLETQTNNVPACRFYEGYGFELGGYDRHLYDELPTPEKGETALFWYKRLHISREDRAQNILNNRSPVNK